MQHTNATPGFTYLNTERLEDYLCAVCLDYFSDPVGHSCGNTFCKDCLSQCRSCPKCRGQVDMNLCHPNLIVRNQTNAFHVRCNQCSKTMERQQFSRHATTECFIFCRWGCQMRFDHSTLHQQADHEANCDIKPQRCISLGCRWKGKRGNLVRHLKEECMKVVEVPPVKHFLSCTLEEIFRGCTKKQAISCTFTDVDGSTHQFTQSVEFIVHPGTPNGHKFTLHAAGDIKPGEVPADLVFVLQETPHELFSRDAKDNLICHYKVSFGAALGGFRLSFKDLEGVKRRYLIPRLALLQQGFEMIEKGLGMPVMGTSSRGDLIFNLSVDFSCLTPHVMHSILATLEENEPDRAPQEEEDTKTQSAPNVPHGRRPVYDTAFLLSFKSICKEKPEGLPDLNITDPSRRGASPVGARGGWNGGRGGRTRTREDRNSNSAAGQQGQGQGATMPARRKESRFSRE